MQPYENLNDIPPLPPVLWPIKECSACHLSPHLGKNKFCKQVVPGSGNLNSEVLFVLMTPGFYENEYGFPAIGLTGSKLKEWLRQLGIDPYQQCFFTNSIMCALPPERTKSKTRNKVDQKEMDACRKNLSIIIDNMPNLKLVVCVGKDAFRAMTGSNANIKDLTNNLFRFTWESELYSQKEKKLLGYALYHPSFVVRTGGGDDWLKEQAEVSYQWSLKFLQQIITNLDDLEKLKPSGETIVCETEEQGYEWARKQLGDNRINAYVIDFETLESNAWYAQAMCAAFAYFNPDKNCFEAFVVPFLKCEDLPKKEWFKRRRRKSLQRFLVKWKWTPWFSDGFAQNFMDILRPLFDVTVPLPEGRERPMLGAYHAIFDQNSWDGSFGWRPCGNVRQFTEPDRDETMPWDFMPALRLCGSQNSMKLEDILKIVMPMIADEKLTVNKLLSTPQVDATGFGLLARKLPDEYKREDVILWAQEYKHFLAGQGQKRRKKVNKATKASCSLTPEQIHVVETYYSIDVDDFLSDALFERAGFDARREIELWKIVNEVLTSPSENAIFTFARDNSFGELFLGEKWHETISQLNDLDLVEQI